MTNHLLFVLDVSLNSMELLSKKATGLERHAASLSSSETQWQLVYQLLHFPPSASFQAIIILLALLCSNGNCPTFCFKDQ